MAKFNATVKSNDGDVFYGTPAAQGISGLFVALAILITGHQVVNILQIKQ